MVSRKRGRPKGYDNKRMVTCVKLNDEYREKLESLANNSHISVYKYVDRLIHDHVDERTGAIYNLNEYDYEEPKYEEPYYWVDEDGNFRTDPKPDEDNEVESLERWTFNDD